MSLGTGPFGFFAVGGVYGLPTVETFSDISSSRKINAAGQYVTNDEGGFEPMDDVAQVVLLRIAYVKRVAKAITPQALSDRRAALRTALEDMTTGAEPTIEIKTITVERTSAGVVSEAVTYRNLRTNTLTTVER